MTEKPSTEQSRAQAIERLPKPYAVALRLRDAGAPDDVIAEALGIDLLSLRTLLELAEAKLAAITRRLEAGSGEQPDLT